MFNPDLTPAGDPDLNGRAARDTKGRRAADMGAVRTIFDSNSEEVQTNLKRAKELLN